MCPSNDCPRPRGSALYRLASPPLSFLPLHSTALQQMQRRLAVAALVVALAACHGKPKAGEPEGAGGAGPAVTTRLASGVAPVLVADSAGIRRYLETVDTVRGATFDVTWSPNTVRLTRDETLHSLRRVSRTGASFTFDAAEPKVHDLKAGQILLVWGIALRKVTAIEPKGADVVVRTDLVSLPEAIQNGHIAWNGKADLSHAMVSPSVIPPDTAQKRASRSAPHRSVFFYAGYRPARQGEPKQNDNQAGGDQPAEDGEDAELPKRTEGEAFGYEYEVGYAHDGDQLRFQLEARKGGDEGPFKEPQDEQGERTRAHGTQHVGGNGNLTGEEHGSALTDQEKKFKKEHEKQEENTNNGVGKPQTPGDILTPAGLFGMANELLDMRVKVSGHVQGLETSGEMSVSGGALSKWGSRVRNLHGDADMDWIARLGEQQGVFSEKVKLEIPWNYDIPLIIGGLPFMIEVGVNILVTPGLTSHHASATGSYHITFDGSAGITASATDVQTESDLTGSVTNKAKQVMSLGVSAVLVAAQVPRIGFGFGLLNTSAVAYIDHVLATSVVTAGATSLIPCRRYQINSTFGAGVGVKILGIPVPGVGAKKVLGTPFQKVETEPQGLNCKVAGE